MTADQSRRTIVAGARKTGTRELRRSLVSRGLGAIADYGRAAENVECLAMSRDRLTTWKDRTYVGDDGFDNS